MYDYKLLPQAGAIVSTDDGATASYSYDEGQQLMISYDTPGVVAKKAGLT